VDWIRLVLDRDQWLELANIVMNKFSPVRYNTCSPLKASVF
jgi:hypothetical protein